MKYWALLFIALLSAAAFAEQTTRTITLFGGFVEAPAANVNYSVNLNLSSPDGLTRLIYVKGRIRSDIPTANTRVYMQVNGSFCNPSSYNVVTAMQGYTAEFDCTSRFTKEGIYNFTMMFNKLARNAFAEVEITYVNDPQGSIALFGTEYVEGDDATLFLLLKDANGEPISNGSCFVDIYEPLVNNTHPEWIDNGIMLYLEEGLYYYDFITPLYSGLYMINAECYYTVDNYFYYPPYSQEKPTRTVTTGTYTGDTIVLNDYEDWLYTQCDSAAGGGGAKVCDSYYEFTIDSNITTMGAVWMGESTVASSLLMYYWNWTGGAWVLLPNNMTLKATAAGVPSGVDEYLSNIIPVNNQSIAANNSVRVRLYGAAGSTFKQFDNWLNIYVSKVVGTLQDLKGSGEVHVSSEPSGTDARFYKVLSCDGDSDGRCAEFVDDAEYDLTEGELLDYLNVSAISTRTNTSIHYTSPFSVDCTALYWIKEFNGTDWVDFEDYTVYSQPAYENCVIDLNTDITAGTEYDFMFKFDNYMKWEVDWSKQIADAVKYSLDQACLNRNFTYEVPITETTNTSNDTVTNFCHQAYDDQYWLNTFYNDSLLVTTAGEYASYVQELRFYKWNIIDRASWLMLGNNTNISNAFMMSEFWNASDRTLSSSEKLWTGGTEYSINETTGKLVVRVIAATGSPLTGATCNASIFYPNSTVYVNFSGMTEMTAYGASGVYYLDFSIPQTTGVYTYSVDCSKLGKSYYFLNSFHVYQNNASTLTAADVWNYTDRTVNASNMTSPADVWAYVDRNLTFYNCSNCSNLTAEDVWAYANRSVNASNMITTTDIWTYSNRSLTFTDNIADAVWTFSNRSLTTFGTLVSDIWSNANRTLSDYSGVWTYTDRNLTYYASTNLTAADVWTYVDRNLSYYNCSSNNLTAGDIWMYTDRNLTFYANASCSNLTAYDVWNYSDRVVNASNMTSPADVWAYTNKTLSEWNCTDTTLNVTNMTCNATTPSDIWAYTDRNLTYYGTNLNASDVWDYSNRTLSDYNCTDTTLNVTNMTCNATTPAEIWNYTDRNLTYYANETCGTSNLTAGDVWNYTTRNLTEYNCTDTIVNVTNMTLNVTNMTFNASDVWNYPDRNLTYYASTNLTAYDVWTFTDRNLSSYNCTATTVNITNVTTTLNVTNMSFNASDVWMYADRNLTYYSCGSSNLTDAQVWSYIDRNLTDYNCTATTVNVTNTTLNVTNMTATDIWTYADRNLTYYNCGISNLTASDVWSYSNRTVNASNMITAGEIWVYVDRNLTSYNCTATTVNITNVTTTLNVTNMSVNASDIWTYSDRNLTYYSCGSSNLTDSDVWNYVDRNLTTYNCTATTVNVTNTTLNVTNMTLNATDIWTYSDRNLTYYNCGSSNLTASDVWTYTDRNLTYYQSSSCGTSNLTASDVWDYSVRNLTYYNCNATATCNATDIWTFSDRNLTYYNCGSGNSNLSANDVWTFTDRNLTFENNTFSCNATLNATCTVNASEVWSYPDRNLTYYSNDLSAAQVWSYVDRNLTYYNCTGASCNLTAYDVWTFTDRNLTYYNYTCPSCPSCPSCGGGGGGSYGGGTVIAPPTLDVTPTTVSDIMAIGQPYQAVMSVKNNGTQNTIHVTLQPEGCTLSESDFYLVPSASKQVQVTIKTQEETDIIEASVKVYSNGIYYKTVPIKVNFVESGAATGVFSIGGVQLFSTGGFDQQFQSAFPYLVALLIILYGLYKLSGGGKKQGGQNG